uniref:Uncharacterized protein n=1 Tax=Ixodes ricinus TaxID=34613 RepID=A0A6B0US20_IXORI
MLSKVVLQLPTIVHNILYLYPVAATCAVMWWADNYMNLLAKNIDTHILFILREMYALMLILWLCVAEQRIKKVLSTSITGRLDLAAGTGFHASVGCHLRVASRGRFVSLSDTKNVLEQSRSLIRIDRTVVAVHF